MGFQHTVLLIVIGLLILISLNLIENLLLELQTPSLQNQENLKAPTAIYHT